MATLRELWAQLHTADPDSLVEVKSPFYTGLGAHKLADEIVAYGRFVGLTVQKETAGGWINKTHYITANGKVRDAIKFLEHAISIEESMNE